MSRQRSRPLSWCGLLAPRSIDLLDLDCATAAALAFSQAFKTRLARPWEMEAIVYGFPTKLQALQFEWAWQNPHASRLLHAPPMATASPGGPTPRSPQEGTGSSDTDGAAAAEGRKKQGTRAKSDSKAQKPVAQFPRTAASNRGQTRIQVLQYMLTVPPWRSFNLRVMLFSDLAQLWWDRARKAGPTVRTDAGWNKFQKELEKEKGKGREDSPATRERDAWGERAVWLEKVRVDIRREGVDGERLVRTGERQQEDAIGRMRIDDGTSMASLESVWGRLLAQTDGILALNDTGGTQMTFSRSNGRNGPNPFLRELAISAPSQSITR